MNARPSFRARVLQAREDAIVDTVNRLLAERGFEAMTVDLVAAEVGIAKASLYKHFPSKEQLAATAMVRVLDRALAVMNGPTCASPDALERLRALARWTLQVQLAGQMPSLPAQTRPCAARWLRTRSTPSGCCSCPNRWGLGSRPRRLPIS